MHTDAGEPDGAPSGGALPLPVPVPSRPASAADARAAGVGLALAGGVVEGGFYEIGVLCALEEAIEGLTLDRLGVYVGVSSGALVCSLLANGVSARTLSRAVISEAEDPSLDIRPEIIFAPAWGEYARRLLGLPGVVAGALRRAWNRPHDRSPWAVLLELGAAVPTGVFDGAAVERYLGGVLRRAGRTNDFRALDGKLRIVAVALDSSEVTAFGDPDTAHVPISTAVQASIALPGLFCPVEIDGRHYVDGVARRTMHASVALREGAELVFCVNPIVPVDVSPEGARAATVRDADDGDLPEVAPRTGRSRRLASYGLPAVLSQTFRTLVHSRLETGFQRYRLQYPDADLVLIEPDTTDQRLFFSNIFSFTNRQGVCEHGYQSTRRWLKRNAATLAPVLARHGLALREEVLAEARTLYPERRSAPRGAEAEASAPEPTPVAEPVRAPRGAEGSPVASPVAAGLGSVLDRLDGVLDRLAGARR